MINQDLVTELGPTTKQNPFLNKLSMIPAAAKVPPMIALMWTRKSEKL